MSKIKLEIVPCEIEEANAFVDGHHRHRKRVQGARFAIAVALGELVVGVAIVGNPTARGMDDGWTREVTRLATDGTRNACSKLYMACWRSVREQGFRRLITYTLKSESGASLRAAGFHIVAEVKGRSWHCPSRPRVDKTPLQDKFRWEVAHG